MSLFPKQVLQGLMEDHGKDTRTWPQELQDLLDPSIEAVQMSPPLSGQIDQRLNREYEYYWAKDVCGATPDHSRIGAMKFDGWEQATTRDVKMKNEDTVKGRNKDGFSNEIRNGDLILMKIPVMRWRQMRKAQNMAAVQTAYPQPYGGNGQPMSLEQFTPGIKTKFIDEQEIDKIRHNAQV